MRQIHAAMSAHQEHPLVQISGCNALVRLLQGHTELVSCIGDSQEDDQLPLHIGCFGALLVHYKDPRVYECTCEAMYFIIEESGWYLDK